MAIHDSQFYDNLTLKNILNLLYMFYSLILYMYIYIYIFFLGSIKNTTENICYIYSI